jgi:hypothetical protein
MPILAIVSANDREGVLPNLAVGSDVVGGVYIAVVDLTARHELIDFNGPAAFDLHGIDLLVFDDEVLALRYLVATGRVLSRDDVTGFGIDVLLLQAVSGLPVDPIEAHLFAQRRRRIEGDGTRHQRQPKVALPIRTRGHAILLNNIFPEVIPAILPID